MNFEVESNILFEDNHLLIINKPSGLLVQQDKDNNIENLEELVKSYLIKKYNKVGNAYLGIPHRIDRPTSGIVVLAKSSKALVRLCEMFKNKEIVKTYFAIVPIANIKNSDKLVHFLSRSKLENKTIVKKNNHTGYKESILNYEILKKFDNYMSLSINLETGRHHQIRAQLSFIGLPIKGDLKYGSKRSNKEGGIDLHAWKVSFCHPITKKQIFIEAPINNKWTNLKKN